MTEAERGILLLDDGRGHRAAGRARQPRHGPTPGAALQPDGRGPGRHRSGEAYKTVDAADPTAASLGASVLELKLLSIMATPLMVKGERLGVLYVDSTVHTKEFTHADFDLFRTLGDMIAMAVLVARLNAEAAEKERIEQQMALARRRAESPAAQGPGAARRLRPRRSRTSVRGDERRLLRRDPAPGRSGRPGRRRRERARHRAGALHVLDARAHSRADGRGPGRAHRGRKPQPVPRPGHGGQLVHEPVPRRPRSGRPPAHLRERRAQPAAPGACVRWDRRAGLHGAGALRVRGRALPTFGSDRARIGRCARPLHRRHLRGPRRGRLDVRRGALPRLPGPPRARGELRGGRGGRRALGPGRVLRRTARWTTTSRSWSFASGDPGPALLSSAHAPARRVVPPRAALPADGSAPVGLWGRGSRRNG